CDIALVETFAEQAVIAIENVHQFRELQARLKREAAMREILDRRYRLAFRYQLGATFVALRPVQTLAVIGQPAAGDH
ncbi:MAG: hypothetical protein IFK92_11285, partial [Acidobacteria bacterium]|nr:hypothetical protein [Candidatus Sulfomarinibacter kjeldsenii]